MFPLPFYHLPFPFVSQLFGRGGTALSSRGSDTGAVSGRPPRKRRYPPRRREAKAEKVSGFRACVALRCVAAVPSLPTRRDFWKLGSRTFSLPHGGGGIRRSPSSKTHRGPLQRRRFGAGRRHYRYDKRTSTVGAQMPASHPWRRTIDGGNGGRGFASRHLHTYCHRTLDRYCFAVLTSFGA